MAEEKLSDSPKKASESFFVLREFYSDSQKTLRGLHINGVD